MVTSGSKASAEQTTALETVASTEASTSPERKFASIEGVCAICGKPIILGKPGDVGSTCKGHEGKVGKYYKPAPANVQDNAEYITLVKLCDQAQASGTSRGFAVKLCGGDAGTKAPTEPAFTVYVQGKRKYVKASASAALVKYLPKK